MAIQCRSIQEVDGILGLDFRPPGKVVLPEELIQQVKALLALACRQEVRLRGKSIPVPGDSVWLALKA
jgi:hypothetical protein